jgi:hypothetical protein
MMLPMQQGVGWDLVGAVNATATIGVNVFSLAGAYEHTAKNSP